MTDQVTLTRYDSNGQRTSTKMHTIDVTAANFDSVQTGIGNMATALLAICMSQVAIQTQSIVTKTPSAARGGHRELKWLITTRDNGDATLYTNELGPADDTVATITSGGREYLDPTSQAWTDIATQYNAGTIRGKSGNALTLVSVELVGRNL